jgi:hypothetical protein
VLAYLSHREAGSRVQLAEAALREADEIAPQQRTVFVKIGILSGATVAAGVAT